MIQCYRLEWFKGEFSWRLLNQNGTLPSRKIFFTGYDLLHLRLFRWKLDSLENLLLQTGPTKAPDGDTMLTKIYLSVFLSLVLCPAIFGQEILLKRGEVKVLRESDFPFVVDKLILEDFSTIFIHKEMAGKKALIKADYFEAGFRTHIVFTLQDSYISRLDVLNNTQPTVFQTKADKGKGGVTHKQAGYGQTGAKGGDGGQGSDGRPLVKLSLIHI